MGVVFKREDSRYWWIAYTKDNKRIRESSGAKTKTLAIEILKHRESQALISPYSISPKNKKVSVFIDEYLEWVKANRRYHTLRSYTTVLKTFNAFLHKNKIELLDTIDIKLLEDYKRERLNKSKTWTVNNHTIILKAFFNKALEWKYISENPAKRLSRVEVTDSKQIRFISEDEYKRFMATAKEEFPEFYPMFYVLIHTGLRKGELLNLEWKDIDLKNGFIHIRSNDGFRPKGIDKTNCKAKERIVPIHQGVINVLGAIPSKEAKVFKTYNKSRLRIVLIKIANKAKIHNLTRLHELRHSYASFLVKKGVDIYKIKELLGHSEIKDTMKYAHMPAVYMKNDVKLLEDLD